VLHKRIVAADNVPPLPPVVSCPGFFGTPTLSTLKKKKKEKK
jgi:hypothetical protein